MCMWLSQCNDRPKTARTYIQLQIVWGISSACEPVYECDSFAQFRAYAYDLWEFQSNSILRFSDF